jgi:trk system potassium uptake protein TrkA
MGQYVVIGLGNFGFNAAVSLAAKGHEVLAMDSNAKRIDKIKDLVTEAVVADAKEKNVLKEFIQPNVDAVIVNLGDTIESSALTTLYLRELGIQYIIVKAVEEIHGTILSRLGATEIINPEKDSAIRLTERLSKPNLLEHIPLEQDYSIVEVAVPDKFSGKTLKELQLRNKYHIEVIAIRDVLFDKFTMIPHANYKLQPDNAMLVLGKTKDIEKFKL